MKKFDPLRIFKIILAGVLQDLAKKHLLNNPQLAILSFDHIGNIINIYGKYEDELLAFLEEFIKKNIPNFKDLSVLDIGANIGNHSIFFSKFFEKVYAFEPNSLTYDLLKINAKYYCEKKNIEIFKFGLSDSKGKFYLSTNKSNLGGSHIISKNELKNNLKNKISLIEVKRADQINSLRLAKIGLIKIDIEGHELKALLGSKNIIKENRPIILFEQHEKEIKNGSSKVINYLKNLGYSFYIINKKFYFGENRFGKYLSFFIRTIFGHHTYLMKTDYFKTKNYDTIIAIYR
tara:strand:+ start:1159 stop:2028 length:870 start_codon:yes stop_codon:yes gene_type:complete